MVGAQPVVGFAEFHQNSILETLALEASPQGVGRRSNLSRGPGAAAVAIAARKEYAGQQQHASQSRKTFKESERERDKEKLVKSLKDP